MNRNPGEASKNIRMYYTKTRRNENELGQRSKKQVCYEESRAGFLRLAGSSIFALVTRREPSNPRLCAGVKGGLWITAGGLLDNDRRRAWTSRSFSLYCSKMKEM